MKLKNSDIVKIVKAVILIPKTSVEISIATQVSLAKIKNMMWPVYEGVNKFTENKSPAFIEFQTKYRKAKDDAEREVLALEYDGVIQEENKKIEALGEYLKEETELENNLPDVKSTDFTGTLKDEISKTVIEYLFPIFSDMR